MTAKCKVTKEKEFIFGEIIQCDHCMKTIYDSTSLKDSDRFYEVTIGHRDWNESWEDNETLTLCSDKCLQRALEHFQKFQKEYRTPYMEISTESIHYWGDKYQKPEYLSDEEWNQLKKTAKEITC